MSLQPTLAFALGAPAGSAPGANLLLWSEHFENAVWVPAFYTVTADAGPDSTGAITADELVNTRTNAVIRQTTAIVAVTGSAADLPVTPDATWQRVAVTGTFGGLPYTFSVEVQDPAENGSPILIRIDQAGTVRCALLDDGENLTFRVARAKLEQSATATAYIPRTI